MQKKKVICIVGARPNFIKAAPLMRELRKYPDQFDAMLVHTGQHYDRNLSQLFFHDLGMPQPDEFLNIGSGSHAEQTARIMIELEKVLIRETPQLVVVFGDVNSTLAAALVAAKLCVCLVHVEAGLRSNDRAMPEEINRLVTDHLSDLLFVSEASGLKNLAKEGISEDKIYFAGNIMIDSLIDTQTVVMKSDILEQLQLSPQGYAAMTLHRPANVDDSGTLAEILRAVGHIGRKVPIIFPCHPRTKNRIEEFGLSGSFETNSIRLIDPLGYVDFCRLVYGSRFVLTDSGGIQEETTYLGIPCLTLRENTERPVTSEVGTNIICGTDPDRIISEAEKIIGGSSKKGRIPELWDGKTAGRIVSTLQKHFF